MSRVRVVLNYVDIAILIMNIKKADTFTEVVTQTNRLEAIFEKATKQEDAVFLKGENE